MQAPGTGWGLWVGETFSSGWSELAVGAYGYTASVISHLALVQETGKRFPNSTTHYIFLLQKVLENKHYEKKQSTGIRM